MDPSAPGLSFHKLEKAKDKRFWSVRVNADIRLIVHKTDGSLLLCYVDHHDRAYAWAERRKFETHPQTGAAQIIELRESVREIVVPMYARPAAPPKAVTRPLSDTPDDVLLGYGVPAEWLKDVRDADEDGLLALTGHLPAEAAEAVLELATGGTPHVAKAEQEPIGGAPDPFTHPDARRRFRVVTSVEELERALDAPWDKWAVFLHPEQRQLVTRDFGGPARVSGSAGTGEDRRCTSPRRFTWLARCRKVAYCSQPSPNRWRTRCVIRWAIRFRVFGRLAESCLSVVAETAATWDHRIR
jgi:hypothetical protein